MDKSPRHCGECGRKGKIIDTRQTNGITLRRLMCGSGHRFSTVETTPKTSVVSGRALTSRFRR